LSEEHFTQLRVGQRQSPQSKVGGSVGYCTEDELNSFNHLVDEEASKVSLVALLDSSLSRKDLLVLFDIIIVLLRSEGVHELVFVITSL